MRLKWIFGVSKVTFFWGMTLLNTGASTGMLWTHVKNAEAFDYLVSHNKQQWNFFWHQEDDYTLTSLGYIWAYPGKKLTNNSICVLPERANYDTLSIQSSKGVCTDYVYKYEKLLE